jgi:hypothetical protein
MQSWNAPPVGFGAHTPAVHETGLPFGAHPSTEVVHVGGAIVATSRDAGHDPPAAWELVSM